MNAVVKELGRDGSVASRNARSAVVRASKRHDSTLTTHLPAKNVGGGLCSGRAER